MWIGLADLPMMPQHRAKCLKMAGVNIKGRAMIYGGVGVDTVYPDSIYIGKGVRITAGTKILTHYLDPSQPGVHFRRGEVHIEDDVFIGLNVCICSSVTIHPTRFGLEILPVILKTEQNENSNSDTYYQTRRCRETGCITGSNTQ